MLLSEFSKVSSILAKQHKIKLERGNRWAADIKERIVYYVEEDILNLPDDYTLAMTLHEVAHIHYTSDAHTEGESSALIHDITNAIEDMAVEHLISKDYTNAGEILDSTRAEVYDKLIGVLSKRDDIPLQEKALLYGIAKTEGRGFKLAIEKYEKIGKQVAQYIKRHKKAIINREKTYDLLPMSRDIYDIIVKGLGKLTKEQEEQMKRPVGIGRYRRGSLADSIKQDIVDAIKAGQGWSDRDPGRYEQVGYNDNIVTKAKMLGKKITSILKRNNYLEFAGRFRSGHINTKRLIKTRTIRDYRVFQKKVEKNNQSYAFAICTDVSGSMENRTRFLHTNLKSISYNSAYMLHLALYQAACANVIIPFGDHAKIIQAISKQKLSWQEASDPDTILDAGGGTNIGYAITESIKQLQRIRSERKIIILLTDGSSDMGAVRTATQIAKKANIDIMAILIGRGSHYTKREMEGILPSGHITTIQSPNENNIPEAFTRILKSTIKLYAP